MKYVIYVKNGNVWMAKTFKSYREAEGFKVWADVNGYETTDINN